MSRNESQDVNCDDIVERMHHFIDNELAEADIRQIQAHLEDCAPCLHVVDVERLVKSLVARSCCERAPVELRRRVMFQIRQIQVDIVSTRREVD